MADVVTVTIPGLPPAKPATGDEQIAVYQDGRLKKMPQAFLRGSRTFSGPTPPPTEADVVAAMKLVLSDRWKNTLTGDEWKVTDLSPVTFTPDGNPSTAVLTPVIADVATLKTTVAPLPGRIATLENNQRYKLVTRQTYAEFAALTLAADTTYAVSEQDTGTHAGIASELGYSGGQVPNSGQFSAIGSPLVLRRVADAGTAAIPGIQASFAQLARATNDYRPSDVLDAWTNSALFGDTAPSIALGPTYSLVDAADGKALRVASGSTVGVGPKHASPFYVGETYEYTAYWSRATDGSDATVNMRLRGFAADGSSVGTMSLLSRSLLVADGFKADPIQVTGAAIKAAMPTAVTVREYVSRSSTGGTFDLSDIRRSPQSLANAPFFTEEFTADDSILMFNASANRFEKWPKQEWEKYVLGPARRDCKTVTYAPGIEDFLIVPPSDGGIIENVRIQNVSKEDTIAISFADLPAAINMGGAYTFGPGAGRDFDRIPQGRVGIVSSNPLGSPITCDFTTTGTSDPNDAIKAIRHLLRFQGETLLSAPRRAAITNFYNYLDSAGWIEATTANGAIFVGRSTGNFDSFIDWTHPGVNFGRPAPLNDAAFPDTDFGGTTFNGNNAIDTEVSCVPSAKLKHFMIVYTDTTLQGVSKISAGSANFAVGTNRTTTTTTVRSGKNIVVPVTGVQGGLQGFKRESNDGIRFYKNNTQKTDIAQTFDDTTFGTQTPYIGAVHGLDGIQLGATQKIELMIMGQNNTFTDAMWDSLYAAFTTFRNALGG